MAKIELLHGSDHVIETPTNKLGKINNDYGRGFYCTQDHELAAEWACKQKVDGYINKYELDMKDLNMLDLCDGTHTVLEWIAILLEHRTFRLNGDLAPVIRDYLISNYSIKTSKYDVIRGYRADDSYFQYAEAFVENALSINGLGKALTLGNLGIQIALVSKKAFEKIQFTSFERVDGQEYYTKYIARDKEARDTYKQAIRNQRVFELQNELFAMDILREEIKRDDERIQRIVST